VFIGVAIAAATVCSGSHGNNKPEESVTKEAQQLDLFTANRFHDRLEAITKEAFLSVSYGGRLGSILRPVGLRPNRSEEADLTWTICEYSEKEELHPILFHIHVSLKKLPETVAICNVNKKKLYLRVSFPSDETTLDTKVGKERKDLTIRKLITLLEGGD
jgi:hypothetical protein